MQFSVEILDHIFSFLVSSRETLCALSKEPALASIVERHLYYHLVVRIGKPTFRCCCHSLGSENLSEIVSKNPRILNYVRILQIEIEIRYRSSPLMEETQQLDEFAKTLRMFPVLECIILSTSTHREWYWSGAFRAALEDRLNLPTVKEVRLLGHSEFPSSLLDNRENIKNLSLSAPIVTEGQDFVSAKLPKLQSLTLFIDFMSFELLSWIKLHINDLKSLKYAATSGLWPLSEMLGICSQSLRKLDISLIDSKYYSDFQFRTGETCLYYSVEFLPIPYNPLQLTLRTSIQLTSDSEGKAISWRSSLAAAVETLKSFISPPQHLVLDIDISLASTLDLASIDFGPLVTVFGARSPPVPRIDFYVHTRCNVTHADLLPLLEQCGDIEGLIKDGVLVIHPEKVAPEGV